MLEFFVLAVQNKQPEVLQMQRPWTHLAEPTDGGGACLSDLPRAQRHSEEQFCGYPPNYSSKPTENRHVR